jgi:hypothetical protein
MSENHDESVGGNVPKELREVFDGVRQRYRDVPPPAPGAAVSAFLDVGLAQRADDLPMAAGAEPSTFTTRGRRAVSSITAFIGTAIGKVVLGATVAAASVGAGQAAGVINVVPHHHRGETVVHTTDEPAVHPTTTEVRDTEADDPESTQPEGTEPETTEPAETSEPVPTTVVVVSPPVPVVSGHDDQGENDDHQGDEVDDHQGDTGDHHGDEADDDQGDDAGQDQGDDAEQPESGDDGGQHQGDQHDGTSTDGDHQGSED